MPAAITRVGTDKGGTAATTVTSFTITYTPTYPNIMVLTAGIKNLGVGILVSQTNVAWVCDQGVPNNTENGHGVVCAGTVNPSPGSTITVSVLGTTAVSGRAIVAEYSGRGTGPVFIQEAGLSTTGSSNAPATTAFNSVDAQQLLIATLNARGTWSTDPTTVFSSPTNSFTIVDQTNTTVGTTNADISMAMLERITVSTVSATTAGAAIGSAAWSSNGMSFRIVAGGQRSWVGMLPIIQFLNKCNLLHPRL